MSKLRLQKQGDDFVILNEHRDCAAGFIRARYEVVDYFSNKIAVVRSVDEAVAALATHLKATPPRWESGGTGRYIKLTHEFCDSLEVEKTQDGGWTALRNGWMLGNADGPMAFSMASRAQRAADSHANDGHPNSTSPADGLSWLTPTDGADENWERCRIEHQLGAFVADAAEAIAQASREHSNGAIQLETVQAIKTALRRLRAIQDASLFGGYDTEHGTRKPYFVVIASGQQAAAPVRVSFEEAAQHYGKLTLHERLGVGVSDVELEEMVSRVLARVPSPDRLAQAA
jgi:hypothetical protein